MSEPKVVMTSGVFDLLHRGHLNFLWRSKQLGDILVVGVVSDTGVLEYKSRFPEWTQDYRVKMIRDLSFVDSVLVQRSTDPSPLLRAWRPDIFTHGDDWDELLEGAETLAELGVVYTPLPYTEGISTTLLRSHYG